MQEFTIKFSHAFFESFLLIKDSKELLNLYIKEIKNNMHSNKIKFNEKFEEQLKS
jgi:hypothetical protein